MPPSRRPERIAWVDVEDAPVMTAIPDPVTGEPLGMYAEFASDLPLTDPMVTKARAVCDDFDSASCEANGCQAGGYTRPDGTPAPAGIGWGLAGEADEQTVWMSVTLVQRRETVIAVCADCSPGVAYEGLWSS